MEITDKNKNLKSWKFTETFAELRSLSASEGWGRIRDCLVKNPGSCQGIFFCSSWSFSSSFYVKIKKDLSSSVIELNVTGEMPKSSV